MFIPFIEPVAFEIPVDDLKVPAAQPQTTNDSVDTEKLKKELQG